MLKLRMTMIAVIMLAGAVFAAPQGNDQQYYAADASPAVWVVNSGTESVIFEVIQDDGTNTITIGSTVNSIVMSGTDVDTISELEAAVNAATNSAGKKVLTAYRCAAAGTESVDAELLVGTVTIGASSSGGGFLWDTSDTKHYRVYIPPSEAGPRRGQLNAISVYGDIKGTGNITSTAYVIRNSAATAKWSAVVVSPIYVPASSVGLITNVADEVSVGNIDYAIDLSVGSSQGFLFSSDRATTATTGNIGVRTKTYSR